MNSIATPTLLLLIGTTIAALRKKRVAELPKFLEQYRQRFFGDDLHVC